jgi:hypothetical protein
MKIKLLCALLPLILFACNNKTRNEISETNEVIENGAIEESKIAFVAPASGMNLRKEGTSKGEVVKLLPYMAEVEILEKSGKKETIDGFLGEWIKVKYQNLEGFVFDGYLLPLMPATANNSGGLEAYFVQNLVKLGTEQYYQIEFDDNFNPQKKKISKNQIKIEEESSFFETQQEYAGGYILANQIGYEYSSDWAFFPNLNIQQVFLLARTIFPTFIFNLETCSLNLKNQSFPTLNKTQKINNECEYKIEVEKKAGKIYKISFAYELSFYSNLIILERDGGIEIKNDFAL